MNYEKFQELVFDSILRKENPWNLLEDRVKRKDRVIKCEDGNVNLIKRKKRTGVFYIRRSGVVFMDTTSYHIFSSIILSFVCSQIVEIVDVWKIGNEVSYLEEDVEPCTDEKIVEDQLQHILFDLEKVEFKCPKGITSKDLYIRSVGHSYKDSRGIVRSGKVTLCLKPPLFSSFKINNIIYTC